MKHSEVEIEEKREGKGDLEWRRSERVAIEV